jgi:hypothetical protein
MRLTPQHAGRFMRTRSGERVGPVEYDVVGFGLPGDKFWRAPIGRVRAYYLDNGRITPVEERPEDIVGTSDQGDHGD